MKITTYREYQIYSLSTMQVAYSWWHKIVSDFYDGTRLDDDVIVAIENFLKEYDAYYVLDYDRKDRHSIFIGDIHFKDEEKYALFKMRYT